MKDIKTLLIGIVGAIIALLAVIAMVNYFFFSYGYLNISSEYNNFTYQIDGEEKNVAESPIKLRVGSHTITAQKEDYSDFSSKITIKSDKTTNITILFDQIYNDSDFEELRLPTPSGI